jgi:periplasmic divalent cation tolerance protein
MQYYLIYITTKDEEEARKIGRTLVEEKLVACVNIHPIKSIYWWEEEIMEESEIAMLVKTKAELVDEVIKRVKQLHSYEVPCIISLPIEKGYPDFLKWINQSTK